MVDIEKLDQALLVEGGYPMCKIDSPEKFAEKFIGEYAKNPSRLRDLLPQFIADREAQYITLLKTCGEALKVFAKFNDAMQFMGGNFPQTGVVYGINAGFPQGAEITREDFAKAYTTLAVLKQSGILE